jgi:beta-galactosidase
MLFFIRYILLLTIIFTCTSQVFSQRKIISLNGIWEVEETADKDAFPKVFNHTVPVPSLIDMALPKFDVVKKGADSLRYFWYRKTFIISQTIAQNVLLQIKKSSVQ